MIDSNPIIIIYDLLHVYSNSTGIKNNVFANQIKDIACHHKNGIIKWNHTEHFQQFNISIFVEFDLENCQNYNNYDALYYESMNVTKRHEYYYIACHVTQHSFTINSRVKVSGE